MLCARLYESRLPANTGQGRQLDTAGDSAATSARELIITDYRRLAAFRISLAIPAKMHAACLFLLLSHLSSVASGNIVLIITDDQDSVLDGMVAALTSSRSSSKI